MTESTRIRLPCNRDGTVTKKLLGDSSLYIIVNKSEDGRVVECFGASTDGLRAELDGLCGLISIALQGGGHAEVFRRIVKFLRFRRYPPEGNIGQACSVSDALAQALEESVKDKQLGETDEGV